MSASSISVIVVNYNGAGVLGRFVRSALASVPRPLELIVVDNASTDASCAWLRTVPEVRLVASEENLGFGGGCNLGAREARGDVLVFANPDVELDRDTLACMVDGLADAPRPTISFASLVEGGVPHERMRRTEDVATMAGALMLVTREHFEALGGFDPSIFLYYEDSDLCWRSWLAGGRVVKDWNAVARHEVHGSGGGPRWAAEQIRNGLYVHLKLRAWPAVSLFVARSAVKTVVRGVQLRDPAVVLAWARVLRVLPRTLRLRRAILAGAGPERRERLEALCAEHDRWQRRRRIERWRNRAREAADQLAFSARDRR